MRAEFAYFYPVDLRTSGKDLIQNHLTMALFNHAAIWDQDPSKWIRGIYCNGHILVDGEKMAKSAGNFILLRDAVAEYTADGCRLAFAEAGDSLNDANFVRASATEHILRLSALVTAFRERQSSLAGGKYRTGARNLFDRNFENTLNDTIARADALLRPDAVPEGHERGLLRAAERADAVRADVRRRRGGAARGGGGAPARRAAAPADAAGPAPAEYLWQDVLGNAASINDAAFPAVTALGVDAAYALASKLIADVAADIRAGAQHTQKAKRGAAVAAAATTCYVYTREQYLPWQVSGLELLKALHAEHGGGEFPKDAIARIAARSDLPWLDRGRMPEVLGCLSSQCQSADKYGAMALKTRPPIRDADVLAQAAEYLARQTGVAAIVVVAEGAASRRPEHDAARAKARPMKPALQFE